MQENIVSEQQSQRLRAIIEIGEDGELIIFPICNSDQERRQILDALRFVSEATA